jgi:hypothetical protein
VPVLEDDVCHVVLGVDDEPIDVAEAVGSEDQTSLARRISTSPWPNGQHFLVPE